MKKRRTGGPTHKLNRPLNNQGTVWNRNHDLPVRIRYYFGGNKTGISPSRTVAITYNGYKIVTVKVGDGDKRKQCKRYCKLALRCNRDYMPLPCLCIVKKLNTSE